MKNSFLALLEFLRMIIILMLFLWLFSEIEKVIYQQFVSGEDKINWYPFIGNLLLFHVLYRNYFQFKGWYKSNQVKKLGKMTTIIITAIALILIGIPLIIW